MLTGALPPPAGSVILGGMDQERADYEDYDAPPSVIDSPAELVRLTAKTVGVAVLCVSVLLALGLIALVPVRLMLR